MSGMFFAQISIKLRTMKTTTNQAEAKKSVRKELTKKVYGKLVNSLSEYNLKENKQVKKLKKVSRKLAIDIMKANKKKAKARKQQTPQIPAPAPKEYSYDGKATLI